MKKIFLLFALILYSEYSHAQVFGLIANQYYEVKGEKEHLVHKTIYIVYSPNACQFYVNGSSFLFPIRNYRKSIDGKYSRVDFLNEETDVIRDGWYDIGVSEGEGTINFEVSLPNDFTYWVPNAKKYNPDGEVKERVRSAAKPYVDKRALDPERQERLRKAVEAYNKNISDPSAPHGRTSGFLAGNVASAYLDIGDNQNYKKWTHIQDSIYIDVRNHLAPTQY